MLDRLVQFLIDCIKLFKFWYVVAPFDRGITVRLGVVRAVKNADGTFAPMVREPGRYWLLPFGVDKIYDSPNYVQTMRIGPQSLVTKDEREIVVSTLVTHRVADPVQYLVSVQGGEQAIEDTAYGVVADFVRTYTWDQIVKGDVAKNLTEKMRKRADKYGIKVESTAIVDLTKSRSLRLIQHDPTKVHGVTLG